MMFLIAGIVLLVVHANGIINAADFDTTAVLIMALWVAAKAIKDEI